MRETIGHPSENDLALLAGGDAGRIRHFLLKRHVRACADCGAKIAAYRELRAELTDLELPDLNWNYLAADMRANIRLGLEAGACVRASRLAGRWNAPLIAALACLVLLAASSFFTRDLGFLRHKSNPAPVSSEAAFSETSGPTLRLTGGSVEIRSGANSLMLLNHQGREAANRTVSAQGDIGTRSFDSETGSVTINNVYLQ